MAKRRPILAGLDIGTQKVAIVIAEPGEGGIEVLGVGTALSRGIRSGRVCDVDKTAQAIAVALSEAELMAGCQIHRVSVAVSGDHVRGTNSHGVVAVDNGEVSARAARRVIEAAQAVPLPADQKILHLICREYIVDGQGGIQYPVGMSGVRLEANLHIISGCESALGNVKKCCNKAGLSVTEMLSSSLVAGEAVLEPEEKELGVAVVDIGAGTVDIAVYHSGVVVHSCVIPVAGLAVTNDLAHVLETSVSEAEALKKHRGCAVASQVEKHATVEVDGVGGRAPRIISQKLVADIIEPRLEEIFEMVGDAIVRAGYGEMLTSGIVLTGGVAMTKGIADLASRVLQSSVRVGEPLGVTGLSEEVDDPTWSAAVGLVHGVREHDLADGWGVGVGARIMPQWLWRKWREFF